MAEIKGVIFDLDGVLVFTDKYHYLAWKRLADRLGIPFDEEANHALRGISRMDSLDILLRGYPGDPSDLDREKLADQKNIWYRELLSGMTPEDVSGEVRETLALLKDRGYLLAVGSSSKNTDYILERVDLKDAFDAVADGTMITRSKPDPEVFLIAAQLLGFPACACCVVEDAPAGIDAAKAAGMLAVGIGEAAHYSRTDVSVRRIGELPGLII